MPETRAEPRHPTFTVLVTRAHRCDTWPPANAHNMAAVFQFVAGLLRLCVSHVYLSADEIETSWEQTWHIYSRQRAEPKIDVSNIYTPLSTMLRHELSGEVNLFNPCPESASKMAPRTVSHNHDEWDRESLVKLSTTCIIWCALPAVQWRTFGARRLGRQDKSHTWCPKTRPLTNKTPHLS